MNTLSTASCSSVRPAIENRHGMRLLAVLLLPLGTPCHTGDGHLVTWMDRRLSTNETGSGMDGQIEDTPPPPSPSPPPPQMLLLVEEVGIFQEWVIGLIGVAVGVALTLLVLVLMRALTGDPKTFVAKAVSAVSEKLDNERVAHAATRQELAESREAADQSLLKQQADYEWRCRGLEEASQVAFAAMMRDRHHYRDLKVQIAALVQERDQHLEQLALMQASDAGEGQTGAQWPSLTGSRVQSPVHSPVSETSGRGLRVTLRRLPRDQGFGLGLGFEDAEKVVIKAIGKDTPAMRSGRLHLGDRVAAINGQPVSSTTDLAALLKDATIATFEMDPAAGASDEDAKRCEA